MREAGGGDGEKDSRGLRNVTKPRTPKQSGRGKTRYTPARKSEVATVRETSARAQRRVRDDAETEQYLRWLDALTTIADLVSKQRMSGVEIEQLLQEIRNAWRGSSLRGTFRRDV